MSVIWLGGKVPTWVRESREGNKIRESLSVTPIGQTEKKNKTSPSLGEYLEEGKRRACFVASGS